MNVSRTGCFRSVLDQCGFILDESEHEDSFILHECEQKNHWFSITGADVLDPLQLMVGRTPVDMTPMSAIPNLLIWDLQAIADSFYNGDQQEQQQQQPTPSQPQESVTSKFCYVDDYGRQICQ